MKDKKIIFWDFDGVIMESNKVRDLGFEQVLKNYPPEQVGQLMEYHQKNGGLSRYVKFRYFFEQVRREKVTDEEVQHWANQFSEIMMQLLINAELLIEETVAFIKKHHEQYIMHIVSGSDQTELRKICEALDIAKYFKSIHGSPTPKNNLVSDLISQYNYNREECVLIGDSINDYEAARINGIGFCAYNNTELNCYTTHTVL